MPRSLLIPALLALHGLVACGAPSRGSDPTATGSTACDPRDRLVAEKQPFFEPDQTEAVLHVLLPTGRRVLYLVALPAPMWRNAEYAISLELDGDGCRAVRTTSPQEVSARGGYRATFPNLTPETKLAGATRSSTALEPETCQRIRDVWAAAFECVPRRPTAGDEPTVICDLGVQFMSPRGHYYFGLETASGWQIASASGAAGEPRLNALLLLAQDLYAYAARPPADRTAAEATLRRRATELARSFREPGLSARSPPPR